MSKSITIRLDDDVVEAVKRQAEETGTTVTGLITDAVRRELDPDRKAFLQAAADFNTPENWAYVQERFGKKKAA
ncbi:ribbon-helix-helix domain-containing protein [Streptomyces sp. NPDC001817]|uniref:ribbon-helix-helix domain-containing protein n=1 Tax=Streptomyces sp. NPDC001817 TaxID=3154398 RepID=UPI00332C48BF